MASCPELCPRALHAASSKPGVCSHLGRAHPAQAAGKCPVAWTTAWAWRSVLGHAMPVGARGVARACWGARVRLGGREKGPLPRPAGGREGRRGNSPRLSVTSWGRGVGSSLGMPGGGGLSPPGWHPSATLSSRLDGPLPSGVRVDGDTLGFPPLAVEHSGTYVCHVSNELSSRDSQVTVEILGKHQADRTWAETGNRVRGWAAGLGGAGAGRAPQTAAWPRRPPGRLREAGGPGVGLGGGGGCHRRAPALPPGGRGAADVSVPPAQGPADDAEIVSPTPRHTGRGGPAGPSEGRHAAPPPAAPTCTRPRQPPPGTTPSY